MRLLSAVFMVMIFSFASALGDELSRINELSRALEIFAQATTHCKSSYPNNSEKRTEKLKCVRDMVDRSDYKDYRLDNLINYAVLLSTKQDRGQIDLEEVDYLVRTATNKTLHEIKMELQQLQKSEQEKQEQQEQQEQECIPMKRSGVKCYKPYGVMECRPVPTDRDRREFENIPFRKRCTDELFGVPYE